MNAEAHEDVYGIHLWGEGYFKRLPNGDLALLNPRKPEHPPVSLPSIISRLEARGINTPVLIRVASYLKHSIESLNRHFAEAIASYNYKGNFRGVFPIKVNQQAQVVQRITEYGAPFSFGLEAGSKPELVIALSQQLSRDALIVCNGVKDREFLALAIRSRKLGFNTIIVLESLSELDLVMDVASELGERPLLGVRIKLNHRVSGNWAESSGDRSTFGLTLSEIITAIDRLKAADMLDCLVLQHSHLGSQIPNVNDVRRAVTEACRMFTGLVGEGVPLAYLDLGGGLGIDYTGQKSSAVNSLNYTPAEYCANIIEAVRYAMDEAGLDHPTIVTESGRAVSAHSSFLILDVLDATNFDSTEAVEPEEGDHHLISDLAAIKGYLSTNRVQECFNDARFYRDELRQLFSFGNISLREMARAEKIFRHTSALIKEAADQQVERSAELDEKLHALVDIYHCNFSLFQSLPDAWAIDQLHPIAPLQRLNERPTRRAILSDITCDSDGKIDKFVTVEGEETSLPVHPLVEGEKYHLGVFLIGAYQETLGDLHNLFGDTNVVTIDFDGQGGFNLLHEVDGDSIADVLSYVEYDPRACVDAFKAIAERAVDEGRIDARERRGITNAYKNMVGGYTYFEKSE